MDKNTSSTKKQETTVFTPFRTRSEGEMRQALEVLSTGIVKPVAPNYDPPVNILGNAIDELLQLRQVREDVLQFIHDQHTKLTRR